MSQHHADAGWARVSAKVRKQLERTLPTMCVEGCGQLVMPGQEWDVCHTGGDLAFGGSLHDYGVGHRRCNRSKGGKVGAAVTKAKRRGNRPRVRDTREARW